MVITAGATIGIVGDTSGAILSGEVNIQIATDGKIVIKGKLKVLSTLELTSWLYVDLSEVGSGRA